MPDKKHNLKIIYDATLSDNKYEWLLDPSAQSIKLCYFDKNIVYEQYGFSIATDADNSVCFDCAKNMDPQILNIFEFILLGKDEKARINKLNIGLDNLRKMLPVERKDAKKCPLCSKKRVYFAIQNGRWLPLCQACGFVYMQNGLFSYNGKVFNHHQALKALKMKVFI